MRCPFAVKRIEDVRLLRTVQFAEDAGPMSHPVRPDQYMEINNFYTVTIYEKGAEVVRMMQTLVGRDGFKKGMALYFERHDGQAVTCDDFVQAISDANPTSALSEQLSVFKRWYAQAGTPRLSVRSEYDEANQTYTLHLSQRPPSNHLGHLPFVIPVEVGLLNAQGLETHPTQLLVLTQSEQSFAFHGVSAPPTPSILRRFSAPVILEYDASEADLLNLLAHDSDAFNQWESAQQLCLKAALHAINEADTEVSSSPLSAALIASLRQVLRHPELDSALKELVLTMPSESYIAEQLSVVDPAKVHAVREAMKTQLARELHGDWAWVIESQPRQAAYQPDPVAMGERALSTMALHNLCLHATQVNDAVWPGMTYQRFKDSSNMTERFGAMSALVNCAHPLGDKCLEQFHHQFSKEALVIDKWFALQASATDRNGQILAKVKQLMQHPDFQVKNPNRARSLLFSYCMANPGGFHKTDASGYVFWAERVIEIDSFNPQVAARLARALDRWRQLAQPYQHAAQEAIKRVAAKNDLSNDVREVVNRSLGVTGS